MTDLQARRSKTEVTFEDGRKGAIEGTWKLATCQRKYGAGEAACKEAAE
jgi:hypothetical protein